MRCPKCGRNTYSHHYHQEIYENKTKITRFYGCRNCHHKFCTVETIIGENLASWNEAGVIHIKLKKKKMED